MNRILGIFAVSSVLLTACGGGGIQSPDFIPVLKGVFIASAAESAPSNSAVTVAPSAAIQLLGRGLYSVPPGTRSNTAGLFDCDGAGPGIESCTLGPVPAGVSFGIDPSSNSRTFATVSADGLLTGVRRGQATVRARLAGFTDSTRAVVVNGPVLKAITITARDVKNNTALTEPATVPTGRTIQLTATATCQTGSGASEATTACTNFNYNFNWQLAVGTADGTAEFTPNPPAGQIVAVKTKRFGSFNVEARLTNEEGDPVMDVISLNASARVLDDIIVATDPAQPSPVPVVKGATTRFLAKGLFSDGQVADISSVNLAKDASGACVPLRWSADSNAVGQFEIEQSTSCPNAAVLVTAAAANRIGSSGINARGTNSELPTGLLVEDRVAVDVREVDLLSVTKVCLRSDAQDQCSNNSQVELSLTPTTAANASQYVVRGTFRGDATGVERNIDPALVPMVFTKGVDSAAAGQINIFTDVAPANGVPDAAVSVVGSKTGPARLTASLDSAFAPAISERSKSTDIIVMESSCRDQLYEANGTSATMTTADTVGLSEATNAVNVIDTNPSSFGTYSVGPSVLGGTLTMSFNRPTRVVTPAASGRRISFVLNDRGDDVRSIMSIQTLDAAGAIVDNITTGITRVPSVGRAGFSTHGANATLPFTGVRLTIRPPLLLGILAAGLSEAIVDVLLSGGAFDVDVYTACADAL